jgi:hypothetical protein
LPGDEQCVPVILGNMIGDAAGAAVHGGAAEGFVVDLFPGGGEGQFRSAEVHVALAAHDHHFVAQRGDVGAARGARTHHHRDLRDAVGRHADLVVEDRTELAVVGKDVGHVRQKGAAAVDQGDAGQAMLPGKHLGAHMLLARHAVIGATLYRGVVGDDHAGPAGHQAHTGDDARPRRHAFVLVASRKLPQLQEGRTRIEQQLDAIPRQYLVASQMFGAHLLGTAGTRGAPPRPQILDAGQVGLAVVPERIRTRRYPRCQNSHVRPTWRTARRCARPARARR